MKRILEINNQHILNEISISKNLLYKRITCNELLHLKNWILVFFDLLEKKLRHNLYLISVCASDSYPNIYNNTQIYSSLLRLCTQRFVPPIVRYNNDDKLCLKLLNWLHREHPEIGDKPFAIDDADFAIYPDKNFPLIYFLPSTSQRTLLHLPLFFHELGHYLYILHREEMDNLVKSLQENLKEFLIIPYEHNDKKYSEKLNKAKLIIARWYRWIQEIFCDLIGLKIGGACFIHAFSLYLRTSGRASFYQEEDKLLTSTHPVPWLRVKFLAAYANDYGLENEANLLSNEWKLIASSLGIKEQFFGFYQNIYFDDFKFILNDMIEESGAISFKNYINQDNFINTLNVAWKKFEESPDSYYNWEKCFIENIIKQH
ncbi:MAG: hypothetical protein JXA68_10615 [Ignavibacteriales bacterium]|nr:hypothetical protein [Ignavibacteriales bacterium]